MFRRSSDPLALSEASLLALRPALNTPVLNTDFLPVGPARAAIVVFAEEYGGIGLAIGVQSIEGGQIAVFRNQEPIDADTPIPDAVEPALASAEQMGFLFDEDLVASSPAGQGRSEAMALWGRLMGDVEAPADLPALERATDPTLDPLTDSTAPLTSAETEVPELLLDEVAESETGEILLEFEESIEAVECGEFVLPVEPPSPPAPQLTKFRATPADDSCDAATSPAPSDPAGPRLEQRSSKGRSELARIPLVRVPRGAKKRVPFLARLLSSF